MSPWVDTQRLHSPWPAPLSRPVEQGGDQADAVGRSVSLGGSEDRLQCEQEEGVKRQPLHL